MDDRKEQSATLRDAMQHSSGRQAFVGSKDQYTTN